MNNTYKIKIESPLVRPGITIETECSESYVAVVTNTLMEIVRVINGTEKSHKEEIVDEWAKRVLSKQDRGTGGKITPPVTTTEQDRQAKPLDLRSAGTNPYTAKGPSDIKQTYPAECYCGTNGNPMMSVGKPWNPLDYGDGTDKPHGYKINPAPITEEYIRRNYSDIEPVTPENTFLGQVHPAPTDETERVSKYNHPLDLGEDLPF